MTWTFTDTLWLPNRGSELSHSQCDSPLKMIFYTKINIRYAYVCIMLHAGSLVV